jgi:hypothetical protein
MTAYAGRKSMVEGTRRTSSTNDYVRVLCVIAFTIVFLFALAAEQPFQKKSEILFPAIVASLFSFYGFFVCGRRLVNASSAASYGVLMFIGFPAIFGALGLYSSSKSYTAESLIVVLMLGFLFQCGLVLASDQHPPSRQDWQQSVQKISYFLAKNPSTLSHVLRLSIVMFLLFWVASIVGPGIAAAGFSWIAMLGGAIVAFWSSRILTRFCGIAVVLVTFIVETGLALGSFGRLNLAVLAISLLVIASLRMNSWMPKLTTAILTGPILTYLVNQRVEFLQAERGSGLVNEAEGVGSVVGPFHSAATIADAVIQNRIDLAWGETLFNAVVILIPRALWEDKPVGFGREIVEVTQPWLVSSATFSDAGTFIGEAIWNFGIWLAPIYLLGFIVFIRLLDRRLERFLEQQPVFPEFLVLIMISVATGTTLNIIWGSASTAVIRTLFPLIFLFIVWFLAMKPGKTSK